MTDRRCGAFLSAHGQCTWRVWSPEAAEMTLVLRDKSGGDRRHPMPRQDREHFAITLEGISEGQRYLLQRDHRSPHPDPASRWQPDGVHGASAVFRLDAVAWSDREWRGVPLTDLVIYELHVGTFTPQGTFAAIIPRIDALRELGVTAIELMPVAQFPGRRNWGYDGTYWYAAQNSYGGPRGMQKLIDACHARGMGVILDVVYNHLGPEGNYLASFAPYFTGRTSTPWGPAINFDDEHSEGVRAYVLENVRQWVRDFHVDGLRLDAIHALEDRGPKHILTEMKEVALDEGKKQGWPVHLIAECNRNDARIFDGPDEGGHALDAAWNDDFHHSVHTLLTGEQRGYYGRFNDPPTQLAAAMGQTFVFDRYSGSKRGPDGPLPAGGHSGERFVISIQTHDQVGNRAIGDRLHALISPAQQRLAAGLMLLSPHVPMLFMGEEYAEPRPFPFFCDFGNPHLQDAVRRGRKAEFSAFGWSSSIPDPQDEATFQSAKLSWSWPDGSAQAGLRALYRDLLAFRKAHAALRDFKSKGTSIVETRDGRTLLRLARGSVGLKEGPVTVWFNWNAEEAMLPESAVAESGVVLCSESRAYGGDRDGAAFDGRMKPFEFVVMGENSSGV